MIPAFPVRYLLQKDPSVLIVTPYCHAYEGDGGSAGSHWEKSVIGLGETMLAQVSSGTFGAANFSPLTMALAEDSGWYRANWDAAVSFPVQAIPPCTIEWPIESNQLLPLLSQQSVVGTVRGEWGGGGGRVMEA